MLKGHNIKLFPINSDITNFKIKISWDISSSKLKVFEIDAFAFLLQKNDKVRNDLDFIFYNSLESQKKSCLVQQWQKIKHNIKEEIFSLDISKVQIEISKIAFGLNIYKGTERVQNFNNLKNLTIQILSDEEDILAKYTIDYDRENITSMILAEIYKHKEDWKFKAVGQGFKDGILTLQNHYGVNI